MDFVVRCVLVFRGGAEMLWSSTTSTTYNPSIPSTGPELQVKPAQSGTAGIYMKISVVEDFRRSDMISQVQLLVIGD